MYLIFDIGGTSVKYTLSDDQGEIFPIESFPTPKTHMMDLLEGMEQVYQRFLVNNTIEGIAISCPGAVDCLTGVIGGTSAIPYIHGIPFVKMVSERLHSLPVSIENDARCFALGEMWKGQATMLKHFASIAIGSGIGGALVHDGQVLKGSHLCSGEVSNFPIGRDQNGELRTWSSYTLVNMARDYNECYGESIQGKDLFDMAKQGNEIAAKCVEDFYFYTALGCVMIQYCFDPELIVVGGAVSQRIDLIEQLELRVNKILDGKKYGYLKPKLVRSIYNNRSNLYGALYNFKQKGYADGKND